MKALRFAQVVREKFRITIPFYTRKTIIRELGMPSLDGYILTFKIESIKSPDGIEFLKQ